MQIGDSVWIFDSNHRVYGSDRSAPLYRHYWVEHFVIGETTRSWLIGHARDARPDHWGVFKVAKTLPDRVTLPGRRNYGQNAIAYSIAAVESDVWANTHRRSIFSLVQVADTDTLRRIADIVGFKESEVA